MPKQSAPSFTDERGKIVELTMSQLNALCVIRTKGQVTIKSLASILQVSSPSASTMVDRLVEMGLLSREHSREDRREVLVQVMPKGQEAMAQVEDAVLVSFVELLNEMGPEWAEQWCAVTGRIREILDAEMSTPAPAPSVTQ